MDYRKMSAVSGAIIFFSLAVLMISVIWLAEQRIFFTRDYIIYVKFDDVVGLRDHTQVYLRGYRVGWTKAVAFLADGVRVRVDVNKKFRIPRDSRWEIRTLNFMGEKAITIQPGVSGEPLRHGDQVAGLNKDMVSLAQGVLEEIRAKIATGDWDVRLRTLGDSIDKFHALLEKGERKVDAIDIAALNRDLRDLGDLAAELKSAGAEFRRELAETGRAGRDGLAGVARAADEVSALAARLDGIAGKIERGEGSVGALVNDGAVAADLKATLRELQTLIANISRNPRKYFKFSIF